MPTRDLDAIRANVLDRMERHDRTVRLAVIAAATLEAALFAVALFMIDWTNATQKLVFVMSVLSYTMVVLGLMALGAHVSRSVGRVLAALSDAPIT